MKELLLKLLSTTLAHISLATASTSKNLSCCWGWSEPKLPEEDETKEV